MTHTIQHHMTHTIQHHMTHTIQHHCCLIKCLIFFTCSDNCTEKCVYWWRGNKTTFIEWLLYEDIDIDVIILHYLGMLKEREREQSEKLADIIYKILYPLSKISKISKIVFLCFCCSRHKLFVIGNTDTWKSSSFG